MLGWARTSGRVLPRLIDEHNFCGWPYPAPCHLPQVSSAAVSSIIQGSPSARLQGLIGKTSEGDNPEHYWEHPACSIDWWRYGWKCFVNERVQLPEGRLRTVLSPYIKPVFL